MPSSFQRLRCFLKIFVGYQQVISVVRRYRKYTDPRVCERRCNRSQHARQTESQRPFNLHQPPVPLGMRMYRHHCFFTDNGKLSRGPGDRKESRSSSPLGHRYIRLEAANPINFLVDDDRELVVHSPCACAPRKQPAAAHRIQLALVLISHGAYPFVTFHSSPAPRFKTVFDCAAPQSIPCLDGSPPELVTRGNQDAQKVWCSTVHWKVSSYRNSAR